MTVMDNEDPALPDDLPAIDRCMAQLTVDARILERSAISDDISANMLDADLLMREMAGLLSEVLGTFSRDDDLPDNLLPRIHSVLYRT